MQNPFCVSSLGAKRRKISVFAYKRLETETLHLVQSDAILICKQTLVIGHVMRVSSGAFTPTVCVSSKTALPMMM